MDPLGFSPTSHVSMEIEEKKVSSNNIEKMIASVDALQIELIGSKICEKIVNNLGTVPRARIMQQVVKEKDFADHFSKMVFLMATHAADEDMEKGKRFLTEDQAGSFLLYLLWPVKDLITGGFSRPHHFVKAGVTFEISDYEPTEMINKIAKKIGVEITLVQVPHKYSIYLKLDEKLTSEKSQLVFNLIGVSQGVEVSKETFTINELEEEAGKELASFLAKKS